MSGAPSVDAGAAVRALDALQRRGHLDAVERHVAEAIVRLCGERDPVVATAVALAVRAPRFGHTALDLTRPVPVDDRAGGTAPEALGLPDAATLRRALAASPCVRVAPAPGDAPLVLRGDLLALERLDRAEARVAARVAALATTVHAVDERALADRLERLLPADDPRTAQQRRAVELAARRGLTVITGGPGTGKTTTIATLVATHVALAPADRPARVALAAPTGRAAARLAEALAAASAGPALDDRVRTALRDAPVRTLHRLLRWQPGTGGGPRHDAADPLPHDLVVVDEASMVPLRLFDALLAALAPGARLVLVGDVDQLASVEAGSVLDDLLERLHGADGAPEVVVELAHAFRFEGAAGVAAAAAALRGGVTSAEALRAAVHVADPDGREVDLVGPPDGAPTPVAGLPAPVADRVIAHLTALEDLADATAPDGDLAPLLAAVDGLRVLVPMREGREGLHALDRRLDVAVARARGRPADGAGSPRPGTPVMVRRNDPGLGLANGDVGVVVRGPRPGGGRLVALPSPDGGVRTVPLARLPDLERVLVGTVHKAQGAQFDEVVLVLPATDHPALTRELVHTAATRARRRLTIVASDPVLEAALGRRVVRASGLAARLAELLA